jgi:hypothetical protein
MVCLSTRTSPRHLRWSNTSQTQNAADIRNLLVRQTTMPTILIIMVFVAGILVGALFHIDRNTTSFILTRRQLIDNQDNLNQISTTLTYNMNYGWHTIHVFSGSSNTATTESLSLHSQQQQQQQQFTFAQARQDEVVLSLLRNQTNGYFVDLAANDATTLSNTYTLEKHYSWKGLCVSRGWGER